MLKVEIDWV